MFRKVLLTIGLLLVANVAVLAQGTFKGTVTDSKSGETMPLVKVIVKQNGQQMGAAQTDFDGVFTIKSLPVGKYDIEFSYVGYATYTRTGVDLKASAFTVVNVQLEVASTTMQAVIVEAKEPLFQQGESSSGKRMDADELTKLPAASLDAIVSTFGGMGYNDGSTSTARGQDGLVTMQGNVRKRTGIAVPKEAYAEIQIILGGTPANIGEAVGGVQIITLKPPQSNFSGLFKYETYADYRLANFLTAYLTGPIYSREETIEGGGVRTTTPIGFRFTGVAEYNKFGFLRASDSPYRVVNDAKVVELENNPIYYDPVSHATNYAAEFLRDNDFVSITRPNAKNYYSSAERAADFSSYSLKTQLALAFRFSENATLELTGDLSYAKSPSTSLSYFPLNMTRGANGTSEVMDYSISADFTQRFPSPKPAADATDPSAMSSRLITDVMWNFTFMYDHYEAASYNDKFGSDINDILKYGHIGVFTTEKHPHYAINSDYDLFGASTTVYEQDSWRDEVTSFTPSVHNPILANYTSQLYGMPDIANSLTSFDNIRLYKGLINGDSPSSIYSLFSNVGVQSSSFSRQKTDFFYGQVKASATISNNHDIEMGFQFDQYNEAFFNVSAYSLWSLMRNMANAHITMLDYDHPVISTKDGYIYVDYNRLVGGGQSTFDESMRTYLMSQDANVNATTWMDIDRYDPDWYVNAAKSLKLENVLDMFSTNDLFNSGSPYVSFYGYDHTGKSYTAKNWSLDDFFDPNSKGHAKYQYRPVFSPIYMAGYIQDKFYFQDLIFNVGVRVDYYDGNQYVLKDPYLLYDSYTVGDLKGNNAISINTTLGTDNNSNPIFANAAQDDWVVYVDDPAATEPTIRGYRFGSTWYDANGVEVSSPSAISGESGKPTPYRTAEGQTTATLGNGSGNKVSATAFEDYDPQIVVMPRLAFSFPVAEKSQFMASYDIIARRPSSGWQADYMSYLYMSQISSINNPNLKPERITNYELGFSQALNDKSAINISAYYKETRDLIQLVQYAGADPNPNYYSYDNLDFMTTYGFTLSYDLRKTNRVSVSANYTLQYAEGTGLSTTTMSELIKEGYTTLKMLNPISDDRRHEFKVSVDYRFREKDGWHYVVTRKDKESGVDKKVDRYPLQNLGVNFLVVAQSGRPYTKAFSNTQHTIVGSYRGARLPWKFFVDAVVDKTWPIAIHTKNGKIHNTRINASATIKNLFDIRNVMGVFAVTGSPSDDGYLTDPQTQSVINAYLDPQSYRDLYSIAMNNNYWNYASPRTIRLALTYSF